MFDVCPVCVEYGPNPHDSQSYFWLLPSAVSVEVSSKPGRHSWYLRAQWHGPLDGLAEPRPGATMLESSMRHRHHTSLRQHYTTSTEATTSTFGNRVY